MKKNLFSLGAVLCTSLMLSSTTFGQVNSATMYKGTVFNPGGSGSYYGQNVTASGTYSFAGGYYATASGAYSLALGTRTYAQNSHAVSLGIDVRATNNRSMTIGTGVGNGSSNALINGISNSLMVGFNSNVPTLFVGTSSGLNTYGKVGIATTSPAATLDVADVNGSGVDTKLAGFTLLDGPGASLLLGSNSGSTHGDWGIEATTSGLNFWNPFGSVTAPFGNHRLFIANNGNVSVGTNDSKGYKFAVAGDMVAEEIVVKLQANWPDFVFTDEYGLMKLNDVESYIQEHSHLPNVPSAAEIEEGGINLGEMDGILLQKIEELTLYVLELKHENEALQNQVNDLQEKVTATDK